MPARLSGLANLDPARNPRYLMYVLRQAGVFTGIYLLIETLLLLGLLLAAAAGTRLGPALRVELDSLWLVALVLAIPFWLIPVPALLAEWSQVMEQSSEATQTAFESHQFCVPVPWHSGRFTASADCLPAWRRRS